MTTDAKWDTVDSGKRYKTKLIWALRVIFASELGKESVEDINYSAGYASLVKHVRCVGVGSLGGMGYKTFSLWMQGKRSSKKNVAKRNLVMFQDYVDKHGEGADEKCMCLGQE